MTSTTKECPKCHALKFRVVRSDLRDEAGNAVVKRRCGKCGFEMIVLEEV